MKMASMLVFGSVERVDLRILDEVVGSAMVVMRSLKSGKVDIPGQCTIRGYGSS